MVPGRWRDAKECILEQYTQYGELVGFHMVPTKWIASQEREFMYARGLRKVVKLKIMCCAMDR